MATIKVGIVEDEMIIAEGIASALEQLGYMPTEPAVSYTEALEMIARDEPDVLLIDIQLSGKKDGIDLAWKVKQDYNIPFIFLTANADAMTVERAKRLCPPAYLVKPFNKDDLYTSIEICLYNFAGLTGSEQQDVQKNYVVREFIFIKQGQAFVKVRIDDISYLESDNVYIHVHTNDGKMLVRSTISQYLELIGSKQFIRIHRSYAVNAAHIHSITADGVVINGNTIPLGKTYRDELLARLRLG